MKIITKIIYYTWIVISIIALVPFMIHWFPTFCQDNYWSLHIYILEWAGFLPAYFAFILLLIHILNTHIKIKCNKIHLNFVIIILSIINMIYWLDYHIIIELFIIICCFALSFIHFVITFLLYKLMIITKNY